jgi:hypothetical protein
LRKITQCLDIPLLTSKNKTGDFKKKCVAFSEDLNFTSRGDKIWLGFIEKINVPKHFFGTILENKVPLE